MRKKKIEKLEMERNYDIYLFVGFWIVDVDGDVGRINNNKNTFTRVENGRGE